MSIQNCFFTGGKVCQRPLFSKSAVGTDGSRGAAPESFRLRSRRGVGLIAYEICTT